MVDIDKHFIYWTESAEEDFEVAQQLLDLGRIRHGLFFLHLSLEKMLKAHVCLKTQDIAPRTHNLVRLADLLDISFYDEDRWFLAEMNPYNLEGRYPQALSPLPEISEVKQIYAKAKDIMQWLKKKL